MMYFIFAYDGDRRYTQWLKNYQTRRVARGMEMVTFEPQDDKTMLIIELAYRVCTHKGIQQQTP
jgi:hypothetical protein